MGQAETEGIRGSVGFRSHQSRLGLAHLYVRGLAVLMFIMVCALVYAQFRYPGLHPSGRFPWPSLLLLLSIALFAEAYTVRVGPGTEASAGFLVGLLGIAVLGPLGATAMAIASQALGLRERQWERTVFFAATIGLITGATSLLYWAPINGLGGFEVASPIAVAGLGLGVGLLYQLLNFALLAPIMWLRGGGGPRELWSYTVRPLFPFALFFLAISLGLISVYQVYVGRSASPATLYGTLLVLLLLLPVFGLIYAFRAYVQQRELAAGNARLATRNERLALQAVASQITALDLKDDYTARHSAAVAQWAGDIAAALKLSERERNLTHLASLLHDVGKIGIPDDVLKSPGKLDRVNWSLIEGHCYNGYKILKNIDEFDELATVVLHHHERYDGSGYPRGLVGDRIPLASRIICVADSYSAMVSDRPYGPALPPEIGMAELELHKGTQFDPAIVDCFLTLLETLDDSYRRGEEVDFHMEVQRVKFLRDLPSEPMQARDEAADRRKPSAGPTRTLSSRLRRPAAAKDSRERTPRAHSQ
jgi:hypothetical protein